MPCLLFDSMQLIKRFNQDISQSTHGEEPLIGDDVRLFNKIRKEFRTWGVMLLECAAKGKHRTHPGSWPESPSPCFYT